LKLISDENVRCKNKEILNESGVFLTHPIIFNELRFIKLGIQVIAEFVAFCKKQIFWISVNQNEQIVFVH